MVRGVRVFGVVNNLSYSIPILALVDADPYGLDILSVYKYGSRATVHEGDTLTAPRIELLGIKITEMQGYEVQVLRRAAHGSSLSRLDIPTDKLLPLKLSDESKVRKHTMFIVGADGFLLQIATMLDRLERDGLEEWR